MTIASELSTLLSTKGYIRDELERAGVFMSSLSFAEYHSAINSIVRILKPTETIVPYSKSGHILFPDGTRTITKVSGLAPNVGSTVAGSNGGEFVIASDGAWTFDPSGDFSDLTETETADTSVTYHASDGTSEAMGTLTVTVNAVQPWTPAAIETALWLDAADSSTITLNGSTVSEWRDKSGNARHATQGTTGVRPAYTENGIVFSADRLSIPVAAYPLAGVGYILMVVMTVADVGTEFAGLINIETMNDNPQTILGKGDLIQDYINGGFAINVNASCKTHGILALARTAGITTTLYRNGAQLASSTRPGNLSALTEFTLGWNVRFGYYRNGIINELVVITNTADNRQRIEGYLAHKWGLAANLPSDHPYKTAAPTL